MHVPNLLVMKIKMVAAAILNFQEVSKLASYFPHSGGATSSRPAASPATNTGKNIL